MAGSNFDGGREGGSSAEETGVELQTGDAGGDAGAHGENVVRMDGGYSADAVALDATGPMDSGAYSDAAADPASEEQWRSGIHILTVRGVAFVSGFSPRNGGSSITDVGIPVLRENTRRDFDRQRAARIVEQVHATGGEFPQRDALNITSLISEKNGLEACVAELEKLELEAKKDDLKLPKSTAKILADLREALSRVNERLEAVKDYPATDQISNASLEVRAALVEILSAELAVVDSVSPLKNTVLHQKEILECLAKTYGPASSSYLAAFFEKKSAEAEVKRDPIGEKKVQKLLALKASIDEITFGDGFLQQNPHVNTMIAICVAIEQEDHVELEEATEDFLRRGSGTDKLSWIAGEKSATLRSLIYDRASFLAEPEPASGYFERLGLGESKARRDWAERCNDLCNSVFWARLELENGQGYFRRVHGDISYLRNSIGALEAAKSFWETYTEMCHIMEDLCSGDRPYINQVLAESEYSVLAMIALDHEEFFGE